MSGEQSRGGDRAKKGTEALAELVQGMQTQTKALVVEEIARAREYLKNPLSAPECETYLKQLPLQLLAELQLITATVELRQKTELAEYMRRMRERAEEREIDLDNLE